MYSGINSRFFNSFTLEIHAAFSDDFDPVYKAIYDAFLKMDNSGSDLSVSLGRLDFVYTGMERTTSPKKILPLERSISKSTYARLSRRGIYCWKLK